MKIGIMGGTFNPIHNGHLLIAEHAHDQFNLDEVWIMPAGIPPHKQNMDILSKDIRCELIEEAIKDVSYFRLDRREVDSTEISYTYRTLTKMKNENPSNEYYFIMGGDSIAYFDKWKETGTILNLATVLVAVRDDVDATKVEEHINRIKSQFSGSIYQIITPSFNVSSAEIRKRIKENQSIRFLVPDGVWKYIKTQNLYKD